ncbi:FecR family protein [Deminuibacter soli]|uniref:DUF4974 domain-containing protein n=1 Tax=Deminuibacter soli TaxID=2291815 RepID=A0A3E1NET3_9BACT|nr:FecR family protein [Deminuibacter soli]RFM26288.1 DUF4974 domain-containing protein [Deminuibacter soli]
MNNRKEFLQQLLGKNTWTNTEQEWLRDYLDNNNLFELEEVLRQMYDEDVVADSSAADEERSRRMLGRIHQRLYKSKVKSMFHMRWLRLAAAAAVFIIAVTTAVKWIAKRSNADTARWQQVVTASRERKVVHLPDGSVVTMEAGSSLRFREGTNDTERVVYMKGEAFFDVKKNPERPFIVYSPLLKTVVMGTSFEVTDDSANAKVVVVTGAVRVEPTGFHAQGVVLHHEEATVYGASDFTLKKMPEPAEARFNKQRSEGRFVYNGTAMSTVVADVERYYKVNIRISDKMKNCLYYGTFDIHDRIGKVLKIIALSMKANLSEKDLNKTYILSGGNCN